MTAIQTKPFHQLTARDLMTRDLLLIPKERPFITQPTCWRIPGQRPPVVDSMGRCIGVLSTTDFMRFMEDEPRRSGPLASGLLLLGLGDHVARIASGRRGGHVHDP